MLSLEFGPDLMIIKQWAMVKLVQEQYRVFNDEIISTVNLRNGLLALVAKKPVTPFLQVWLISPSVTSSPTTGIS